MSAGDPAEDKPSGTPSSGSSQSKGEPNSPSQDREWDNRRAVHAIAGGLDGVPEDSPEEVVPGRGPAEG